MFSRLLTSQNVFFISRQKILLKRRKITSKRKKVAKKKFLEQNPQRSFTNQLKILQIQKQLDKKVNKNHHLNQLMDQIFYPDVRYANQKIIQEQLIKITSNPQHIRDVEAKGKMKKSEQNERNSLNQQGQVEQDQFPRGQQFDQLQQQLSLCQIPSQLFELYSINSDYFTHYHLQILINRLRYYFKNKNRIQQHVTKKWKQSLQKLKLTSEQQKKRKRCPYIFIEKEQIVRDEGWNFIVKDVKEKIQKTYKEQNEENERGNEKENNQEIQQIDQSYFSVENNCDLLINMLASIGYMPEEIYNTVVDKVLKIVEINRKNKKRQRKNQPRQAIDQGEEYFDFFTHSQKVKLLRVLAQKSQTKSTLTRNLTIDSPQRSTKYSESIIALGKKLCLSILNSPNCTSQDLGAIIRSGKGYYKFLNFHILTACQPLILKFLPSTNLQRSIDYFYSFWLNGTLKDIQFLQILKFDIYRKLPQSISKRHLFFMLSFIKQSRIYFKESKIALKITDIYPKIVEVISSKYLTSGQLTHEEIIKFLNSIYTNYPLTFANCQNYSHLKNIVEIISTEVVKIQKGFKLEQLAQILLKTTILGHRSKIFSKYLLKRFTNEYKKMMKKYKQEKTQLIEDKSSLLKSNKSLQTSQQISLPSMNQVLLQEKLIMFLWSFMLAYKQNQVDLPLNDLIQIYPLKVISQDPMIKQMIKDLNEEWKEYNFFPEIKSGVMQSAKKKQITIQNNQEEQNKQVEQKKGKSNKKFKRTSLNPKEIGLSSSSWLLLQTNTYKNYFYDFEDETSIKQLVQHLQSVQRLSQKKLNSGQSTIKNHDRMFLDICMRYCLNKSTPKLLSVSENLISPNRWSDISNSILNNKHSAYEKMRQQFYNSYVKKDNQSALKEVNKETKQNSSELFSLQERIEKIAEQIYLKNSREPVILSKNQSISNPSKFGVNINTKLYELL